MKFVDHKKRGWKSRNAYQNLWLGAQTSSYLYTWSYHTIILMILVCCISTYICRFLPDSPARCQGTLAIGWEALACSSHGGFSSLDVPFQYSLTLLKHVLRSLYIFDDYYIIIYIHQLFIARYVYIYIYMHNSYIIMMERPLTCKLVTVSIAQTGCAAAQSHRLTLAAPQFAPLRPSQGPRLPLVVSTCFNHRFSQPPAIEWLNTIIP